MKLKFLLILSALFFSLSNIYAQPVVKQNAKKIINRTANVIHIAQQSSENTKILTGDFKKSVSHQVLAVHLFDEGKYNLAICHSLESRKLAKNHIVANSGTLPSELEISDSEKPDVEYLTNEQLNDAAENFDGLYKSVSEEKLAKANLTNIDISE